MCWLSLVTESAIQFVIQHVSFLKDTFLHRCVATDSSRPQESLRAGCCFRLSETFNRAPFLGGPICSLVFADFPIPRGRFFLWLGMCSFERSELRTTLSFIIVLICPSSSSEEFLAFVRRVPAFSNHKFPF